QRIGDLGPIGIDNGIAGILPALVLFALRGPGEVFTKAVAIHVSVSVSPVQALERGFDQRTDKLFIAGPVPQSRDHHAEVNGSGNASVVTRVRIKVEYRKRIGVQLMNNFAGLLVTPV